MNKLDCALFVIATLGTGLLSGRMDDNGYHMFELYSVVVLYYIFKQHSASPATMKPAAMIFTLFFISMVLPDIYGSAVYSTGPDDVGTVGGVGWKDGILLWPFVCSLIYLVLSGIAVAPRFNGGVQTISWGEFARQHLSPIE